MQKIFNEPQLEFRIDREQVVCRTRHISGSLAAYVLLDLQKPPIFIAGQTTCVEICCQDSRIMLQPNVLDRSLQSVIAS